MLQPIFGQEGIFILGFSAAHTLSRSFPFDATDQTLHSAFVSTHPVVGTEISHALVYFADYTRFQILPVVMTGKAPDATTAFRAP